MVYDVIINQYTILLITGMLSDTFLCQHQALSGTKYIVLILCPYNISVKYFFIASLLVRTCSFS